MSLTDYQTNVDAMLRDRDSVVTTAQRDTALAAALAEYSVAQPRTVVVDVTGGGSSRIDLPAGFTTESELTGVEYPIGFVPSREVPLGEVSIYAAPTLRQIELPMAVGMGDAVRVSYTTAHVLDATQDTVPARHAHALACLAASMLCGQLASYYAGESESTIGADAVNHLSKSGLWRTRMRDLANVYTDVVGAAPNPRKQPASATVQVTSTNALGRGRMFHPTRNWRVN